MNKANEMMEEKIYTKYTKLEKAFEESGYSDVNLSILIHKLRQYPDNTIDILIESFLAVNGQANALRKQVIGAREHMHDVFIK